MRTGRYGNIRIYFRRKGRLKVCLKQPLGSDEFFEEYRLALSGKPAPQRPPKGSKTKATLGSLRWLVEKYYEESESFFLLDDRTKHVRKLILDSICLETLSDEDPTLVGSLGYSDMPPLAVRRLRDRKKLKPEAANARVKALRQLFKFGVEQQYCSHNPAREVSYIRTASEGFHTWDLQEVRQFEQVHPLGTKARLVVGILLYSGAHRSDVVNFGRQHVRNPEHMSPALREQHPGRWLQYTQHKNRNKKPVTLTLPILPELEEILAASPLGDLTWLVTEFGKGFTAAGFGNWFREQCNRAGLHHCSAHGLRKAGATIAAENGASVHTLKSMFGWQTLKQAEHYTKAADQKRLAASGMQLIGRGKK
jgi:site-specific recombinase XerD